MEIKKSFGDGELSQFGVFLYEKSPVSLGGFDFRHLAVASEVGSPVFAELVFLIF